MPSSGCKKCARSEEHTSELQSHDNLVCRLLLEKKHNQPPTPPHTPTPPPNPTATHTPTPRPTASLTGSSIGAPSVSSLSPTSPFFFLINGATPSFPPFPPPELFPI